MLDVEKNSYNPHPQEAPNVRRLLVDSKRIILGSVTNILAVTQRLHTGSGVADRQKTDETEKKLYR